MRQLRESLLEELNSKNMLETIGTFNHLFRYSGTAEGEAAVSYLEEKLSEYGIPFEHCEYDGFFSLPVRAFAKVDGVEYQTAFRERCIMTLSARKKDSQRIRKKIVLSHFATKSF